MHLQLSRRPSIKSDSNIIPVFYACDSAYIKYMAVSISSLIAHSSADKLYDIHILHTGIAADEQARINVLADGRSNISIEFNNVKSRFEAFKSKISLRDYYTSTTYYRFFIPEMFPHLKKALYIDSDTLILDDVADLYGYRLGSNLIGAVPDMLVRNTPLYSRYVEDVLNISQAAYFNAGVVLINCKLFRKEEIYEQFIKLLNTYTFVVAQDQDYLNILCQDRILWLNSRWNVQMTEITLRDKEDISLIHYNLAEKPWHYKDGKYSEYFWETAEKTNEYAALKTELETFGEDGRERDAKSGRNLMELARNEVDNEHNYHNTVIPGAHRQITRQEILDRIARLELEGKFDIDPEDDPPGRTLMPDEIDYLHKGINDRLRRRYAYSIARWFMNSLLQKKQLIIKEIRGIENYRGLDSGAIITCNHINAMDTFAMQIAYEQSYQKKRKFYRVIKEGNYTSFPGFYGFLMRNCNTLPLSSNLETMKKFLKAVNKLLEKGHFVLIYPEQSMWWNYKKPKPLKNGGYRFAVNAGVPVLPCFITMEDSDIPGEGGFPVQAYTIHIGKPIYPRPGLSKSENTRWMMQENARIWKETYESFYGIPLTYTTITAEAPHETEK